MKCTIYYIFKDNNKVKIIVNDNTDQQFAIPAAGVT
jgi:uncharacterized protein YaiL (DUF2058 family)